MNSARHGLCTSIVFKKKENKMANGKGYSIHIGINLLDPDHYDGWSGPLNACEADAEDMAKIASDNSFSTTTLLTKDATRAAVIGAVEKAATTLQAGDMLLVSYSGHGGQVPDKSGDEEDSVDETWCLFDGQLLDDELNLLWSKFSSQVRILLFSDSCHSGTVARAIAEGTVSESPELGAARMMPSAQALKTYRANREFYDKLGESMPQNIDVKADGLLISGCQDNQLSRDGTFNGAFTGQLLKTWKKGNFQGNYDEFREQISTGLRTDQTPNLFPFGVEDPSFTLARPFEIARS
jgi:hypothetical protein